MSGAKASCRGLDQLMADARRRRFDAVVLEARPIWALARALDLWYSGTVEPGIRFLAPSQGLDTDESNPASKLLHHTSRAGAQFERELIHERVSAGVKAARKHGTETGNSIGAPAADLQSRGGPA